MTARRRAWRFGKAALPLCAAMFMLPACAPKKPPAPPAPEQPLALPGDFDDSAMNSALASLDSAVAALSGHTAQAHRDAMAASFSAIVDTLIIFEGSEPSWAFQREAKTMQMSRDRLVADATTTLDESAIDAGLLAAYSAVHRLAGTDELSDPAITPWLEKLKTSVDAYGETPSVGKAYIAADSVKTIAMISHAMAMRLAPPASMEAPSTPTAAPAAATTAPTTPAQPAAEAPPAAPAESAAPAKSVAPAETAAPTEPAPAAAPAELPPPPAPAQEINK